MPYSKEDTIKIYEHRRPRTHPLPTGRGHDYYSELTFTYNGTPARDNTHTITISHGEPYPLLPAWLLEAYRDTHGRDLYVPSASVLSGPEPLPSPDPDDEDDDDGFDEDAFEEQNDDFDEDDEDEEEDSNPLGLPTL